MKCYKKEWAGLAASVFFTVMICAVAFGAETESDLPESVSGILEDHQAFTESLVQMLDEADAAGSCRSEYLRIAEEYRERILAYDWRQDARSPFSGEETETEASADAGEENACDLRKRIAATDICADPQPELLFLAAENVPESGTLTAVLHVFTYNGVSAAEVFTQDMDPQSDPSGYCLFQVRDDKNLWIYREDPDAATIRSYTRYSLKGSSFSITYSLLQKAGETENVVNSYEDTCMISGNVFAEKEQEIRSALKDCIM